MIRGHKPNMALREPARHGGADHLPARAGEAILSNTDRGREAHGGCVAESEVL
jgi:hypothetical protein